jgi:hypothetical protein
MVQSWEYGNAKHEADGWKPIRLVIKDYKHNPVAIVQALYKGFSILGGFVRINRGPLMLESVDNSHYHKIEQGVYKAILSERKKRRWWVIFWAPEKEMNADNLKMINILRFKKRSKVIPWGSSRISLRLNEDELFGNLKGKWRNMLRKAQKNNLSIKCYNGTSDQVLDVIDAYKTFQHKRNFTGISDKLLISLSQQKTDCWSFYVYLAYSNQKETVLVNEPDGVLISVVSGNTAIYLVGFTNNLGRKYNANYLMLWQAIIDAKKTGCNWFDLGGINENTSKGIAHFKRGVNAESYKLLGEFIIY